MAELGSGSGSGYPGALDTDTAIESASTTARADVPNDLAAAIIAIETELGTDPAGTLADVKTYLQTEHEADGTHNDITPTSIKMPSGANITDWPSFNVHRNSVDQTGIVTATWTKIQFTTEEFDTNNNFDNSTNYRFTPTVAGKYLLTAAYESQVLTTTNQARISIYKNGVLYLEEKKTSDSTVENPAITVVVDANGSTDYFEVYAYHNYGSDRFIEGDTTKTRFMGCRIG